MFLPLLTSKTQLKKNNEEASLCLFPSLIKVNTGKSDGIHLSVSLDTCASEHSPHLFRCCLAAFMM